MPNRLGDAASPYLRSAAHQPVEWYPWGGDAFDRARGEDRPILLDIGAVWCHWCHVIDRESYENPEIAALINAHFVPVKVDRDERPDVDVRYQQAVGAISGQGGWPLTAFLTPEGKVFFGGTYFPPDAVAGRPGFKQVLRAVAEFYRTKRDQAHAYADELHQTLQRLADARSSDDTVSPALVDAAIAASERAFDSRHGGFGGAPKFPHTGAIELLLRRYDRTRDPGTLLIVTGTLEHMAHGGVYDQIGGGFHRYSVDASWTVPHFEKMLYDNAELLRNYVHAYQATGNATFRDTARGIVAYVSETLTDTADGGFYASQDADISLEDDGDYYTWTPEEAAAVLPPDEMDAARLAYHLNGRGEMQHDPRRHVLFVATDADAIAPVVGRTAAEIEELLVRAARHLREARAGRPAPFVDRTVYVGWNGMMSSALLDAARGLGDRGPRAAALRALDRIVREAYDSGRGFRHIVGASTAVTGLLDDQVHMARALLDAFEHTGNAAYLRVAEETMAYVMAEFVTPAGAFYDVAGGAAREREAPGLAVPHVPAQDAPTPAGNAVAVMVLDRLWAVTGNAAYRDAAERALRACAPGALEHGLFAATLAYALDAHLDPPLHVVVVGPGDDPRTAALHDAALTTYRPGVIAHLYDPRTASGVLPAPAAALGAASGPPRGYACTATACAPPEADPEALRTTIRSFGRTSAP
ncbi:MAG TPA: thioredoxin domain-containing protein [bacterium]|nr:thioredoxin domain-containing protein [bacterium]